MTINKYINKNHTDKCQNRLHRQTVVHLICLFVLLSFLSCSIHKDRLHTLRDWSALPLLPHLWECKYFTVLCSLLVLAQSISRNVFLSCSLLSVHKSALGKTAQQLSCRSAMQDLFLAMTDSSSDKSRQFLEAGYFLSMLEVGNVMMGWIGIRRHLRDERIMDNGARTGRRRWRIEAALQRETRERDCGCIS